MRKALITLIVATFATLGFLTVAGGTASAADPTGSDANHASAWEAAGYGDCTKVDGDGKATSVTLAAAPQGYFYTVLVIKAGSIQSTPNPNKVILNPVAGTAYDAPVGNNGKVKVVSHYIFCVKPVVTQTSTPSTSTATATTSTATSKATTTTATATNTTTATETAQATVTATESEAAPAGSGSSGGGQLAHTGTSETLTIGAIAALLVTLGALLLVLNRKPTGKHARH